MRRVLSVSDDRSLEESRSSIVDDFEMCNLKVVLGQAASRVSSSGPISSGGERAVSNFSNALQFSQASPASARA